MRYLLDTHVWLWAHMQPARLGPTTRAILDNPNHELLFSAIVSWEIAIKHRLGKLKLPRQAQPQDYIRTRLQSAPMTALPISIDHSLQISQLPAHHQDPFDRLLIAQAQCEKLTLITADRTFSQYNLTLHWANE